MNRAKFGHVSRVVPTRARLEVVLALSVAFTAITSPAAAASFRDARDDFRIDIEQADAAECITYPEPRWDRGACEGLVAGPPPTLADGALGPATHAIGAATFRAPKWGFRVVIARTDGDDVAEWEDAMGEAFAFSLREASLHMPRGAELVDGEASAKWDLRAMIGTHVARVALTFREADLRLRKVDYAIAARHGTYRVTFVAPDGHAAELGALAERAIATVQVTPPDVPRPRWIVVVLFTACIALLVAGLGAVVVSLGRRRRRQAR
jgi:hypothetical protein